MRGKCNCNVALWCLRFIFFVASLFSCSNFNLGKNFEIIKYPVIRVYGLIVAVSVSFYYFIKYESSRNFFNESNAQLSLIYFEFNIYWFLSVAVFLLNIFNQNRITEWFSLIIDKILGLDRAKFEKFAVILLSCHIVDLSMLAVYVPLSFSARSQPDLSVGAYVIYYTLCGVTLITTLQIVTGVSLLVFVFSRLRLELSETFAGSFQRGLREKKLRGIIRKYQTYHSLALDFNEHFSIQNLMLTLLLFVELTYSTSYIINVFDLSKENLFIKSGSKVLFSLCFFAFYSVQLLEYGCSAQMLADEVNELCNLANSALSGDSDELHEILEIIIVQRANLNIEITAANLFKVDNKLIFRMVGIVSSTTVVLLQFSNVSVENCYKNSTMIN